jgi:TatD DNase family protein
MIDTHSHINTEKFDDDRNEVIKRAFDSGVKNIIIPAIEPKDFESLHKLVLENDKVYCGIGIHPHNVKEVTNQDLDLVNSYQQKDKVVATGEIGVDYYYDFAPKDKQKDVFDSQIKIALDNGNPIIVHNRDSDDDVLEIIKSNQSGDLTGVMHCFSSGIDTLRKTLDLGLNVSFTGNITFKKMDLDEVVSYVPNDRFMIETDSPYMAPVPNRGKRNEPSFVRFVAEKIADIKKISFKEVVQMSTENAKKLFNLPIYLMMFLLPLVAFSQEEYYYEDEEYYEDEVFEDYNRFYKTFGIGFTVGTSTVVENWYELNDDGKEVVRETSKQSVLSYGGLISYFPIDHIQLRFGYTYSKNTQDQDQAIEFNSDGNPLNDIPEDAIPEANIHNVFELSSAFIANPVSRVEFYGVVGGSYILNSINGNSFNKTGFTFGLGATINFWENDFSTIAMNAEWNLNYEIGRYDAEIFDFTIPDPATVTKEIRNFFSVPRATISYFVKL